jgi:hypothetical protein
MYSQATLPNLTCQQYFILLYEMLLCLKHVAHQWQVHIRKPRLSFLRQHLLQQHMNTARKTQHKFIVIPARQILQQPVR